MEQCKCTKGVLELVLTFDLKVTETDQETIDLFSKLHYAFWNYKNYCKQKLCECQYKYSNLKSFADASYKYKNIYFEQEWFNNAMITYKKYVRSRPIGGAVIFDQSSKMILMVKNVDSDSWSLPKGKVEDVDGDDTYNFSDKYSCNNEIELQYMNCACREVYEETGLDISDHLKRDDLIKKNTRGAYAYLYIVRDWDISLLTEPQVKNEIADVKWHPVGENLRTKQYTVMVRELASRIIEAAKA